MTLLTATEVAERLHVSRPWLYRAAREGKIPSVRLGGDDGPLRFVSEDVDAWLERMRAAWQPGDSSARTISRGHGS